MSTNQLTLAGPVYHDLIASALVRSGTVMALVRIYQGTRDDVEPPYTEDELADLLTATVTTAVEKLP